MFYNNTYSLSARIERDVLLFIHSCFYKCSDCQKLLYILIHQSEMGATVCSKDVEHIHSNENKYNDNKYLKNICVDDRKYLIIFHEK
ncbi:hypothetical protein BpHYR1_040035 [Brachionus plicatilis]|uniref:Uncharacterized protein n=1 Tax=Brachionus plicatilis TaxID=10195 RepID=A0A3M7R5H6_BRAPC|nr:hypothetical protein BpHYR1_040035 [Brachionus plicatilis]